MSEYDLREETEREHELFCNTQCPHYDGLNWCCWLIPFMEVKPEDLCHRGIVVVAEQLDYSKRYK